MWEACCVIDSRDTLLHAGIIALGLHIAKHLFVSTRLVFDVDSGPIAVSSDAKQMQAGLLRRCWLYF
jgi:hypothetical protein